MLILPPWNPQATMLEQCEALAALVRCAKPTVVVESGTYTGFSALFMADACRRNGVGHVWTADPVYHSFLTQVDNNDLRDWVTYFEGDFAKMVENLGVKVDFAYIDGSGPGPDGAILRSRHFNLVKDRFLAKNGIICVDDTHNDDWADGLKGVSVREIRKECLNFRFLRGLSIYYR